LQAPRLDHGPGTARITCVGGGLDHPVVCLSLGAVALAGSSFACAGLARQFLAALPGRPVRGQLLAGLAASVPIIGLAFALTITGQTYAATTAGCGTAFTYLLIVPAALLGKMPVGGSWMLWRRAVLPFCLATAATWVIIATTGHFRPLDGQFLITLFVLGTWLFCVESKTARVAINPVLTTGPTARIPNGPLSDSAEAAGVLPEHAVKGRIVTVLLGLAATVLTIAGTLSLLAGRERWVQSLVPLFGGLTCVGPLLVASRETARHAVDWLGGLGYATMAAACLVPGIVGFVQPGIAAPPLYGPDGAFLALAAGVLLALGEEGLTTSRYARRLLVGTWALWMTWVLLSVLLALRPQTQSPLSDPSVWDLP